MALCVPVIAATNYNAATIRCVAEPIYQIRSKPALLNSVKIWLTPPSLFSDGVVKKRNHLPSFEKASSTLTPLDPTREAPLKPDMTNTMPSAMVGPIPSMAPPG